jgi:hypothetical protein
MINLRTASYNKDREKYFVGDLLKVYNFYIKLLNTFPEDKDLEMHYPISYY